MKAAPSPCPISACSGSIASSRSSTRPSAPSWPSARVAPRVVADDGMFAIRPLMTATLSADHRVVDGAIGARFLQAVKQFLESPAA